MVLLLAGAVVHTVLRLRCPKCGHVQARARVPTGTLYSCRECKHRFTLTCGMYEAATPSRPVRSYKRRL